MPASAPSKSIQAAETEAFERELAALTAYEDGWDRWDGPVWPVGYEQCRLQATWGGSSVPTTPATEEEGLRFETRKA